MLRVFVLKEGKEPGQGVAYLDDGTMVVVDQGKRAIGRTIEVAVTSVLQTTAGKMIFCRWPEADRDARAKRGARRAASAGATPATAATYRGEKRRDADPRTARRRCAPGRERRRRLGAGGQRVLGPRTSTRQGVAPRRWVGRSRFFLVRVPLALALTAAYASAAASPRSRTARGRTTRRIGGAWSRLLLRLLRVDVRASGLEHVPAGPAVYAANHASALDIFVVFGHLPADFRIVYKGPCPSCRWWAGRSCSAGTSRSTAATPSARGEHRPPPPGGSAGGRASSSSRRARAAPTAPSGLFKRGSFGLAIDTGVPVVPVSLVGAKAACLTASRASARARSGWCSTRRWPAAEADARRQADERSAVPRCAVASPRRWARGARPATEPQDDGDGGSSRPPTAAPQMTCGRGRRPSDRGRNAPRTGGAPRRGRVARRARRRRRSTPFVTRPEFAPAFWGIEVRSLATAGRCTRGTRRRPSARRRT